MHVNIQMYADDAVISTHAKNIKEVYLTLTSVMTHDQTWHSKSCLHFNIPKKLQVYFRLPAGE